MFNFNPPTPRRVGRRIESRRSKSRLFQSTHPSQGGTGQPGCRYVHRHFNPPTPRRVGHFPTRESRTNSKFQSTHPSQGGTRRCTDCGQLPYFNPPTPRRVGLRCQLGDVLSMQFQSTHPSQGGTLLDSDTCTCIDISIHPPLAGWDALHKRKRPDGQHFNPPTPRRVGPGIPIMAYSL